MGECRAGALPEDLEAQASTYFHLELNVNGYPFKRSNSLLDKGQLFKGKNLLL